jgi:glutamyl-tRNA synthetase
LRFFCNYNGVLLVLHPQAIFPPVAFYRFILLKMEKNVRVRFAPSPTGPLHIGGVRTALYNYLFAKKHGGKFILRIEDTDQNRYVKGAEDYIIESLAWCKIRPDEGVGFGEGQYKPYRQSERKGIYREYADRLVERGFAYYAFDSEEALEALRKKAESEKSAFSYNAKSRGGLNNSLTLSKEETDKLLQSGSDYVIRLKVPADENIVVMDLIRGAVHVNSSQMDDKVLFKSDGWPTYHLANVVDDYLMKITHVIRGEEWLPSAPLHVLLYRYLGWEEMMPQFAHLPLLLKPDGNGKLSKRDGDRLGFPVFPISWTDPVTGEESAGYRERGYFPEAVINMLALLGWHPTGDQEFYTLDELVNDFSLERVSKSGAKFDPDKVKWFNEQYMKKKSPAEFVGYVKPLVSSELKIASPDVRLSDEYILKAINLLIERVQFEHEFIDKGKYLFVRPEQYDETIIAKKWKPSSESFFNELNRRYSLCENFDSATAEKIFKEVAESMFIKAGDVLQIFRVLLSGSGTGVDLFGMTGLFGKDEVCSRLTAGIDAIKPLVIEK